MPEEVEHYAGLPGHLTRTRYQIPEGLTFAQWAAIGTTLLAMGAGVMFWIGDWILYGEHNYGEDYAQALSDLTGLEETALVAAAYVCANVPFSRRRENLTFSHHREIAPLEPDDQDAMLDRAVEEGWGHKDIRRALRRRRAEERYGEITAAAVLAGTFPVVYADPPWRYEDAEPTRAIENQYDPMPLDDICALEIPAGPDAMLFLWSPGPKLVEALEVVEAWEFRYRTSFVWVKDQIGMGHYARQRHELLLVAKRGDVPVPPEDVRPDSVIEAPRGHHSEKPDEAAEIIERMYPTLPRIELFARRARPGWERWGNQA